LDCRLKPAGWGARFELYHFSMHLRELSVGWIGGNKAAQVSVRQTMFVALLVGGLAWPVFAAWPANKQDASWQYHVDGRRPAPELMVEERHLALTQQPYRDPEDFDRYVRLRRMYDDAGNGAFFVVPVACDPAPVCGAVAKSATYSVAGPGQSRNCLIGCSR